MTKLHFSTQALHAGRQGLTEQGLHALPIDLSTTNPLTDIEQGGLSYETLAAGGTRPEEGSAVYGRLWNPTVARFESALASLEHGAAAVAFASGMAAMSAAFLATTNLYNKLHIVAVRPLYGGTDHLLESGLLQADVTYCAADEVSTSVRPNTGLVVIETPANPTLELVNIGQVVEQAGDIPVLVDNTFATPVLQNPLDHGATYALHSATKYLGGHGDAIGGIIACSSEQAAEPLRKIRVDTGALLHPYAAYTFHRGLTTLSIRVLAQQKNAKAVAQWLDGHEKIARVYYPTLSQSAEQILGQQMQGPGAMISIELKNGFAAAEKLTRRLELWTHAVSLGGVDSLIEHPAAITHRSVADDAKPNAGIVRLSVGLEHVEDLIADLDQALS